MSNHPVTLAVRALRAAAVEFEPHTFKYEPRGGTRHSADELGVDEHVVIKTLIFEDEQQNPVCVLMHGDREVNTGELARTIGVKSIEPCAPEVAQRHSGYMVGGTSPFGLKKAMPLYVERGVVDIERVYINGGARGFLVEMSPQDIVRVLKPTLVDVAVAP